MLVRLPGLKTAAAILAFLVIPGALYLRSPLRTPVPDKAAAVESVRPQLERLNAADRELVMGYLLRHRGELVSFPQRDHGVLDAKTFSDAIQAQKEFLARQIEWTPSAALKQGLRDQALRPLRAAVSGELVRRELLGPDQPRLKVTFRVRNPTNEEIEHVEGVVNVRTARHPRNELGMLTGCMVTAKKLAPRAFQDVPCESKGVQRQDFEFMESDPRSWHQIWTPRKVKFASSREMAYVEHQADSALLWGFYEVAAR